MTILYHLNITDVHVTDKSGAQASHNYRMRCGDGWHSFAGAKLPALTLLNSSLRNDNAGEWECFTPPC